jgi:hypothetical protein
MDESVRHSIDKRVNKDPFRLPRSETLENRHLNDDGTPEAMR